MKNLIGAVAASVVMAGAASAGTLSIVGGDAAVLPVGPGDPVFDPAPTVTGLAAGDSITSFDSNNIAGGGLFLDTRSTVTFTFLGKEAGATNRAVEAGGQTLSNRGTAGDSITAVLNGGFLAFSFDSTVGSGGVIGGGNFIENGVAASKFTFLGLKAIDSNSVFALFDDGTNDVDYDDMVIRIDVAAVPLPAGAALMLTALGGLGVAARRKK